MQKAVGLSTTAFVRSSGTRSVAAASAAATAVAAATTGAATAAAAVAATTAGAATATTAVATTAAAEAAATTTGAATAATAEAAAAATTAAAETTRTLFTRARFVDHQRAAVEGLAVHAVDGRLSLGVRAHLHEAEALGAAGVAVHHHLRRRHGTELCECLLQIVVAHAVREVADVEFVAHGERLSFLITQ